uniref:PeaG n=1 Tax=Pseudomonas putida TaxID=303 RepID=E0X6G1_PSEPU|nr:PeaG [Pseudomonas putida DOT-T1E]
MAVAAPAGPAPSTTMRGSTMAGPPSLWADERRVIAQPVMDLLAIPTRLVTQQSRNPSAQSRTAQARTCSAARPHITTKVRLPGAKPGPLAGRTTRITGQSKHPRVAGRVDRPTLCRAGCTQQHASRQRLGTSLMQHGPVLLQAQAEVDQRRPRLHQPQQCGSHLQRTGAGLSTEHLGHQHRHRTGLVLQAGEHRTAVPKLVGEHFTFAQLAVFQPETAGVPQAVGLLRRAAAVDDANAHVSAHA